MSASNPSPVSHHPDVLVVGAGPVGLTVAAELVRHGARVRIVDKRDGPVIHSQALLVAVRTQEILSAMGIVDGWIAAGHSLSQVQVHAFGKKIGEAHPGGVDSPFPGPLTLNQGDTERLLVEALARRGVTVERHVGAVAYSQDAGSVEVTLRHLAEGDRTSTARAPWVVACEGASSTAREAAGIPFDGERYSGQEFLMADAQMSWSFPHGPGYAFAETERTLMCFPFDARGHYRVLCARPDANPDRKDPATLEEVQAVAREMTADPGLTLTEPRWVTRFRTQHRLAGRFREGRIFLAGDAGHVHVPIGGQGMNYGMADAFNLAWKLAAVVRGDARPEPLLNSYDAERHQADAALLHGTDESFRATMRGGPAKALALRYVAPLALGSEAVQRQLRTALSGINVTYTRSPAVTDAGGHGPAAGVRAPDASVVVFGTHETGSLFRLFYAGTRWTLLLFGGSEPTAEICAQLARPAAVVLADFGHLVNAHFVLTDLEVARMVEGGSVLVDRDGAAHKKYRASAPCFYLVRPDGHVGFRGPIGAAGDLVSYLYRVGLVSKRS